jgi:hypothetical protein
MSSRRESRYELEGPKQRKKRPPREQVTRCALSARPRETGAREARDHFPPHTSTLVHTGYILPGTTLGRAATQTLLFRKTIAGISPDGGPSAADALASVVATTGTHTLAPPSESGTSKPPVWFTETSTQIECVGTRVRVAGLDLVTRSAFAACRAQISGGAKVRMTGCPACIPAGVDGRWQSFPNATAQVITSNAGIKSPRCSASCHRPSVEGPGVTLVQGDGHPFSLTDGARSTVRHGALVLAPVAYGFLWVWFR